MIFIAVCYSLVPGPSQYFQRTREENVLKKLRKPGYEASLYLICCSLDMHAGTGVSDDHSIPPASLLSAPHLNSTTRLYHKLHSFKQHKKLSAADVVSHSSHANSLSDNEKELTHHRRQHLSSNEAMSSSCSTLPNAEEMISSKPLQVCPECSYIVCNYVYKDAVIVPEF